MPALPLTDALGVCLSSDDHSTCHGSITLPHPAQDMYGDTALHDAIGKDNMEIIELLGNVPALEFRIKNKRGFNVLHHAALKGNNL